MKNIVIFGDSYLTYENIIPKDYKAFYSDAGGEDGPALVSKLEPDLFISLPYMATNSKIKNRIEHKTKFIDIL